MNITTTLTSVLAIDICKCDHCAATFTSPSGIFHQPSAGEKLRLRLYTKHKRNETAPIPAGCISVHRSIPYCHLCYASAALASKEAKEVHPGASNLTPVPPKPKRTPIKDTPFHAFYLTD